METLQELITRLADRADAEAVVSVKEEHVEACTYNDIFAKVSKASDKLRAKDVHSGDYVAIIGGADLNWIICCLAAIRIGAVVVPIDAQFDNNVLKHVLEDCGARLALTASDIVERIEKLKMASPPEVLQLTEVAESAESSDSKTSSPIEPVNADDVTAVFYTSGTTGLPKGVPLTHENILVSLTAVLETDFVTAADRLFLPLPLHHVYPFVIGMFGALALGAAIVFPYSLTGPQVVRALREGDATAVIGVPRLYRSLYTAIIDRAAQHLFSRLYIKIALILSRKLHRVNIRIGRFLFQQIHKKMGPNLRVLAAGGSALDPELGQNLQAMGWEIAVGYGLTETSPLLAFSSPSQFRPSSVGPPLPNVDLRIDPSVMRDGAAHPGEQVHPEVEHGEIQARGKNVFSGYLHQPDKTKEKFTEDGWFKTGDLGYLFDGHLYIEGRISTMIVTEGGENVQPAQLEEVYTEHRHIREIGILEKQGKLAALIVPEKDEFSKLNVPVREAIQDALSETAKKLPSYQRINEFQITSEALSRTRLGKLQRHVLEKRYQQALESEHEEVAGTAHPISIDEMSDQDQALLENPSARAVWNWLSTKYHDKRLSPDTDPQLDLGVDSLEWLNISMEINQRVNVELAEETVASIQNIRDLLQAVADQRQDEKPSKQTLSLENPEQVLSEKQRSWLKPLSPAQQKLAHILYGLNRKMFSWLFKLKVEGRDTLPQSGPLILAPNHVSYLDAFAIAAALNKDRLDQTFWAGWTGIAFKNPLNRFVSRLAHAVPVDAESAAASSLALGILVLKGENFLVWFPEGRRSPSGKIGTFRGGVGLMMINKNAPAVPVFIEGTEQAMPVGRTIPRRHPVTVKFGTPVTVEEVVESHEEPSPDAVASALRERVAGLADKNTSKKS